jgi:hypothetical protein
VRQRAGRAGRQPDPACLPAPIFPPLQDQVCYGYYNQATVHNYRAEKLMWAAAKAGEHASTIAAAVEKHLKARSRPLFLARTVPAIRSTSALACHLRHVLAFSPPPPDPRPPRPLAHRRPRRCTTRRWRTGPPSWTGTWARAAWCSCAPRWRPTTCQSRSGALRCCSSGCYCVCVCVCVSLSLSATHRHLNTYMPA